jgi:hypothetical protein
VQNYGVNLDFDLFLQRKNGGLSPRVVDRWCFRSTMDPRAERNRSSRSPAKGVGRWRRGQETGWRPHLGPVGDEEATRRRGVAAVVRA